MDEGGEEEEELVEEEDTGPPQIDPNTGQPIPKPKKRRRRRGGMAKRMLGNLSTKPTDFQVGNLVSSVVVMLRMFSIH